MSSLKAIGFFFLLVLSGTAAQAAGEACPNQPARWSSREFAFFYGNCPVDALSPDKTKRLHIEDNSPSDRQQGATMRVYERGRRAPIAVSFKGKIFQPAGVMWSPIGHAFLMMDEQGSGEGGLLRVFVRAQSGFIDDTRFQREAVRFYPSRFRCGRTGIDPVVIPIGWSEGGTSFFAYAQATVSKPCGDPDKFITMKMDVEHHAILQTYTPKEAERMFSKEVP